MTNGCAVDACILPVLAIAPARVVRGAGILSDLSAYLQQAGLGAIASQRLLFVTGKRAAQSLLSRWDGELNDCLDWHWAEPISECSAANLVDLHQAVQQYQPTVIIGAGGGKVLDMAKLLAQQAGLPVVTIPTSAATCAAWTALSNIYSEVGAFAYDVALSHCPELILVDYELIATAPERTLVAGIGDAIAKWYEASVGSGSSDRTMVIAAVQEARILRDILFQKSSLALQCPGSAVWREVVDATVCLAGVIGGMGGAECRTVAAHAIHNGITHLPQSHGMLHGEKVAFGILVQLRLEELQGNQLAATARHQLLKFYTEIGLPQCLEDLGLSQITLVELQKIAAIACAPNSDIHRLPFAVSESQVLAAMVSTTAPLLNVATESSSQNLK